jgi:hypothetical protein
VIAAVRSLEPQVEAARVPSSTLEYPRVLIAVQSSFEFQLRMQEMIELIRANRLEEVRILRIRAWIMRIEVRIMRIEVRMMQRSVQMVRINASRIAPCAKCSRKQTHTDT